MHVLYVFYVYVFFRYSGTVIGNHYGPGIGPIWSAVMRCMGLETSLANCYNHGRRKHSCDHSDDVSISCGSSPVHYGWLS